MGKASILYLALMAATATAAYAQVKAADFDYNNNGQIDPGPEAEAFLKHVNKELRAYREMDTNKDGRISNEERDAYEVKAKQLISLDLDDFEDRRAGRPGVPVAEAERTWRLEEKPKPISLFGLRVRRSASDLPATQVADPVAFDDGVPAAFSYVRDFENNHTLWEAHAAVLYPFRIVGTPEDPRTVSVSLIPSITLDKISSHDENKEVDALVPRLGAEVEMPGLFPAMELQYFRVGLAYATDTRFNAEVGAIEFEWEPVILGWGMHSRRRAFGLFEYRLRALLVGQGGRTFDAGGKENLKTGDNFFRLGPRLELHVWPLAVPRLSLRVDYQFLGGLAGEPDTTYLLDTALNLRLDEVGHVSVELGYQKGRIPLTEDDTDAFRLGVGVKF
jgi:hypothetical protein